jgi:hypothetical protein
MLTKKDLWKIFGIIVAADFFLHLPMSKTVSEKTGEKVSIWIEKKFGLSE